MRKKSPVWDRFECLDGDKFVLCLICKTKFMFSSSTSGMLKHMKTRHPGEAKMSQMTKQEPCPLDAPHTSTQESF